MTTKFFEKKMFKGSRSMSRSSNRSLSTDSGQMTTAPVGHLDIEVVSAEDLTAADFGGKSDPYVVLEMDGQVYRSNTEHHTLSPKWTGQITQFVIGDISSILYVSVYDEDRFGDPEFLGKVALPVVTFPNNVSNRRVLRLRDKTLRRATKGTIELVISKKWEPVKVALQSITPHRRAGTQSQVFKPSTFVCNVQRVKVIMADCVIAAKYIETCFEWKYRSRSLKALTLFVVVTYFFELFMVPLAIVGYIFAYPALRKEFKLEQVFDPQNTRDVMDEMEVELEHEIEEEVHENDSTFEESDDVTTLSGRLKALQSVTVFVQECVGFVASSVESVWTLLEFRVPFMSWIFVAVLALASIVLYLIPLRWIVMLWGVNKFSKKLRDPNHVPSSELLNFLSRVPDGPTIEKCFNEIEPKKDPKKDCEEKKTIVARNGSKMLATATTSASATFQRLNARKTSFLQAKFAKKISKAEL